MRTLSAQARQSLKFKGVGKLLLLGFAIASTIVARGSEDAAEIATDGVSGIAAGNQTASAEETLLARLKRLSFNVFAETETRICISISGGDMPVYMGANAQRDVSGNVYYVAYKMYGQWYIPKSERSLKLLRSLMTQESGWQLMPDGDGRCTVIYFSKIAKDVSDSGLVDAILSVQRMKRGQFPILIDKEYQERWAAFSLFMILVNQQQLDGQTAKTYEDDLKGYYNNSQYNQENCRKMIELINQFSMCPEDLREAAIDYENAQASQVRWLRNLSNLKPDNSMDDAVNFGAMLGSLNQDNPQGGALLGAIFGGMIGAAQNEEKYNRMKAEYDRLSEDLEKAKKKLADVYGRCTTKIENDQKAGRIPIFDANDE